MRINPKFKMASCFSLMAAVYIFGLRFPAAAQAADTGSGAYGEYSPSLTVTGHKELKVRPDEATIRLGVEAQAPTATAAQEAVNKSMQAVIKKIKSAGVANESIQTAGLEVTPVYATPKPGQESAPPPITGYRASDQLRVQLKDLSEIGPVIDSALQAGANRLEGISFGLQNDLHYRAQALQLAADAAKVKARALAAAAGMNLGTVQKIQEGAVNVRSPWPMLAGRRMMASSATPVEPGQVTVEASVMVQYGIEPAAPTGR